MKTVLHFLSVVDWENLQADSNFEVFLKTVRWLPDMHHFVMVPWRTQTSVSDILSALTANFTLLSYEYPANVLTARHEFRSVEFAQRINLRKMDIDFLFCHQPELLGNVLAAFSAKRAMNALVSFVFLHWIDCPASRGSAGSVPVHHRQIEATTLADRFFVHGPHVLKYLEAPLEKVAYMPLSAVDLKTIEPQVPKDWQPPRPYVVFNHRRSHLTGWKKLASWVPDGFDIVYTGEYDRSEYRWILEHAHCAVCMIRRYCTWNLAVQDPLNLGVSLVCQRNRALEGILRDHPGVQWFRTKEEFQSAILKEHPASPVPLENFDANFKTNLLAALRKTEAQVESRRRGGSKYTERWENEIQPRISKAELVRRVHGKTATAHASWQYIRRDLLREGYKSEIVRGETVWSEK